MLNPTAAADHKCSTSRSPSDLKSQPRSHWCGHTWVPPAQDHLPTTFQCAAKRAGIAISCPGRYGYNPAFDYQGTCKVSHKHQHATQAG